MIHSLLDTDLYTFTVGQVAFHRFSNYEAVFNFIDRDGNKLPKSFYRDFFDKIYEYRNLSFNDSEIEYLRTCGHFNDSYLDFLYNTKLLDYKYIHVENSKIKIRGPWYKTIYWEVPFLSTFSEMYHKYMGHFVPETMYDKIEDFDNIGVPWCDFGTRRRFATLTHDALIKYASLNAKNFIGTSNVWLARRYDVAPLGTMSHQGPMAMQGLFGPISANQMWMQVWEEMYGNTLHTFLPDTYTTKFCLDTCGIGSWNWRQDSGDPLAFIDALKERYAKSRISTTKAKIFFSNFLNPDEIRRIEQYSKGDFKRVYCIGTNFTNNFGEHQKALNIVIKLDEIEGTKVVKISDDPKKATGDKKAIANILDYIR